MSALSETMSTRPASVSGKQKVGLVLSFVLNVVNALSVFQPTPDGEVGPPFGILLVGAVLGVVGAVAVVFAWRGSALARRVNAGCLILNVVTSLPAFFVDVPLALKAAVAVYTLLSVLAIVLMFSGRRAAIES